MSHDALSSYLNDHLAGATLGCDHARQLEEHAGGTAFEAAMSALASEIEQDRDTLLNLMERLDVTRNPVKTATAWVAEKAGRVKFSGVVSGDAEFGRFSALETMIIGVDGKRLLWIALRDIAPAHPALATVDFERLIERAESQAATLERERRAVAARALHRDGARHP